MRKTITIDDHLGHALKELAQRSNRSFTEVVNDTLRRGLIADSTLPKPKPYFGPTHSLGTVQAGLDLDKALALAENFEDTERKRSLIVRRPNRPR